MARVHTVHFTLRLSRDALLRWYRGEASAVVVLSEEGVRLQLPAHSLRSFVTAEGISGRFALRYDRSGRQVSLRRAPRLGRI